MGWHAEVYDSHQLVFHLLETMDTCVNITPLQHQMQEKNLLPRNCWGKNVKFF